MMNGGVIHLISQIAQIVVESGLRNALPKTNESWFGQFFSAFMFSFQTDHRVDVNSICGIDLRVYGHRVN